MRKKSAAKSRSKSKKKPKKAPLCSANTAEQLLQPILDFFSLAGMTAATARASFDQAWRKTHKKRKKNSRLRLSPLTEPSTYVELISVWTKSPSYLDRYGEARMLPWSGKSGFCELVKKVDDQLTPEIALKTLVLFGNVSLRSGRRVKLLNPFFTIRSPRALAFEPSVSFLTEAAEAVNAGSRSELDERPHQFWRMVESDSLPEELVPSFRNFISSRSLSFLQDVDDWLSSHVKSSCRKKSSWRAGLGLFAIAKPVRAERQKSEDG